MKTYEMRLAIAGELRASIARAGATVPEVARQAGMTEEEILNRLSGREAFTVDELYAMSRVLNCSILDLLPGRGEAMG